MNQFQATEQAPLLTADFLRRLERLSIAAKRVQLGVSKGERKSKRKGQSVEFADYREYVQGDDLRHVDWNIYGRLESLYLKLFEEQEDLCLHILLDASASMAYGTPHKFDFARRLAAAVGYVGLAAYDRVSVQALSENPMQELTPLRGKTAARKLFAFLEDLEAAGPTHLAQTCRSYVLRRRAKGVALLVSDFFDEEGFEAAMKHLGSTRLEVYVLHVLAPEEMEPQLSGDLKLIDSETEAITEISVNQGLLKRYRKNRDAFVERIRRYCVARGMGYVLVSSDTPIEELTLDVLRKGGLLR
jgi:uncharacterized protein (DUF58 family)